MPVSKCQANAELNVVDNLSEKLERLSLLNKSNNDEIKELTSEIIELASASILANNEAIAEVMDMFALLGGGN